MLEPQRKGDIPFRIIDVHFLENLGTDGDSGVHGIGYNSQHRLGGMFSDTLSQVPDNTGIGIEEIVSGHSWFTGHTSGDEDNIGFIQSVG
jgi:hypothetical protein